jgi:hypothetical protein
VPEQLLVVLVVTYARRAAAEELAACGKLLVCFQTAFETKFPEFGIVVLVGVHVAASEKGLEEETGSRVNIGKDNQRTPPGGVDTVRITQS